MAENNEQGSDLNSAALIIYGDFNIPVDSETDISNSYENLRNILADRIQYLLVNEPAALERIFYRIDINSAKVDEILKSDKFLEVPLLLADLVIDRQLEKVRTRAKYKNPDNTTGELPGKD